MLNKLTLPIVAALLFLWLGFGSWWYASNYCGATSVVPAASLSIVDGDFRATATETFSFFESSADPYLPEEAKEALKALASHLINTKGKQLILFGIYSPDETNPTGFENLGVARAQAIRSYLMDLGVPKSKMILKGGAFNNTSFYQGTLYGGVLFRFKHFDSRQVEPLGDKLDNSNKLFQPVNIYFDVNEDDLILTEELELVLNDMKDFLKQNPSAQIAIIGHADRQGSGAANLSLSEVRARNVKKFMIRRGFDPKRLIIEYRGEDDPMRSNTSDESLRKNRRVELRLKKQ
ncbi:MAG TPA: hypothetical protein ENJ45_06305 [Phaeodactylibacter sp.]|nr:hypothetical protein [Phaeodactylibacter sp.]